MANHKKKTNPRKIPATLEDVRKAQRLGQSQGIDLTFTLFFTAMLDKSYLEPEEIRGAWDAICYVADSVSKGYVDLYDNKKMLEEEYHIKFTDITV